MGVLALAACQPGGEQAPAAQPSAAPAPPVAPVAADGRDYAACADGNCEVQVSAGTRIALGGHGGADTLAVDAVEGRGIKYQRQGKRSGSGSLSTGCVARIWSTGGGSACSTTGEPPAIYPEDGILAMQVVGVDGGTAVLRLVAGKAGPPPTSLVIPMPSFTVPTP
ncbi:hypothetical protein EWH70_25555 [Amycolatopsis suaedae]|uniref:Uncharacterized protein n=1 Tax=Amycolatopsis suaedae TaxID=2510978 RepID=A0A4Q7J5N8_9PSEU|nr:hypothetical protein EWH70_25555 [Amycolatopsis suaedae]